jgi:hypothetical protein
VALVNLIQVNLAKQGFLLAGLSGILLVLAAFLAWEAFTVLTRKAQTV